MLGKLRGWVSQKKMAFLINHGFVKRGRTTLASSTGFGGGKVKMNDPLRAGEVLTVLRARHLKKDENGDYVEVDVREVRNKKVTTAFVNDIVDNLIAETSAFGDYKYHDSGTGVAAEDPSDTGLGTPCGEARTVGSQEEGAQTYEYKSIATHTYAGSFAITEHGLFNASSGPTLMDRTVFSAINVGSGDKIEFTFTIQFSAEA